MSGKTLALHLAQILLLICFQGGSRAGPRARGAPLVDVAARSAKARGVTTLPFASLGSAAFAPLPRPFDPSGPAVGEGIYGLTGGPEDATVVLIPVPWEPTTSYHRGAARGPSAILRASRQIDLFDR